MSEQTHRARRYYRYREVLRGKKYVIATPELRSYSPSAPYVKERGGSQLVFPVVALK